MNIDEFFEESRLESSTIGLVVVALGIVLAVVFGYLDLSYLVYLLVITGMYVLMSLGLNVQWGYAGLINFAVVAFWGVGIYTAALTTAPTSPLALEWHPGVGLVLAIFVSVIVALIIGLPSIRLRADYLAITTLGFSEIFRIIVANQRDITAGMAGISGVPDVFTGVPLHRITVYVWLVAVLAGLVFLFLRRIHRSPWGRVLRTIKADEDLAKSLGKNTFAFKMQAFIIGSVVMTIAGVFYAHFFGYVDPNDLLPLETFFIWVAVILGGSGSNRGAVIGAFVLVAVLEGTRFANDIAFLAQFNIGPIRLLFIGLLIIVIMRYKPEGIYPPRRELIWRDSAESERGQ